MIHNREFLPRYWAVLAILLKCQEEYQFQLLSKAKDQEFSRLHNDREPEEIEALLNSATQVLLMFNQRNAFGKPVHTSVRSNKLTDMIMFKDIRENHQDFYNRINRIVADVHNLRNEADWMAHLKSHLKCVPYTSEEDLRKWRSNLLHRDEVVANFFIRELLLTQLGLFEEVSFDHFNISWERFQIFLSHVSGLFQFRFQFQWRWEYQYDPLSVSQSRDDTCYGQCR